MDPMSFVFNLLYLTPNILSEIILPLKSAILIVMDEF